jgi:capsular polysaccharide biosynthesis protein
MNEFIRLIRIMLRRWWLIVIPVVLVGLVAVPALLRPDAQGGGFATSFRYSAAQELNLPERDGDYQDVWLASEFVVNAFTEWVRSSTFRDELQEALGEDVDLSLLGIASDNARSIGVVQMSYPDGELLANIVEQAIYVLQERNQVYFPHLEGESARVTILDAPVVVPAPAPLTNRFAPLLQLGIALVLGIGLTLLADYFDPTLREADELTQYGVDVLARIPRP